MVGSASWLTRQGNPLTLNAVLKLKYARLVNLNNSLVSGILESLASPSDSNYFGPISMLGFPRVPSLKYTYTLESIEECNATRTMQGSVTSMKSLDVCSIFSQRFITYKLDIQEDNKLRVLVEFQDRRFTPYEQPFRPDISLIGEGSWNGREDEFFIVACHILNHSDPLGSARVGDCPFGMSLWFPAVRSIMKTHNTEGQIWTTKLRDDLGMFRMAKFQSFDHIRENYALKYEYTQMEKVRQVCPKKKHVGAKYQRGEYHSRYYGFDMSVKHKNMVSSGFVDPFFAGIHQFNNDAFVNKDLTPWQEAVPLVADFSTTYSGPVNVSFEISFMLNISSISRSGISSLNLSSTDNDRVEISAEGVYDDETGQICMVGCRNLIKSASFDCEILVKFQFPRGYGNEGSIKGSIESLRETNDALSFENLDIVSRVFTESEARESYGEWI
ncbi:uncharacterized protein LOC143531823 [Bidens hawaiensis]|uniref:uncharacterized protein LOC143531823 n=1 Tax=Bidens hawaiensis TaxID=980011 RepID=UPI00404AEC11